MNEEEAVNIFKNYIYIFRDIVYDTNSCYSNKDEARDCIEMCKKIIKQIKEKQKQIDEDALTVAYLAGFYTIYTNIKGEEHENKIYGKI